MPAPGSIPNASSSSFSDVSHIGPGQSPEDAGQGGAPAGRWISDGELPVRPTCDNPERQASTGGFSPSPATHPLPEPGLSEGTPHPPTGYAR